MSDIAIRVENLSKLYHIGALQQRHDTLRDALTGMFRRGHRSTNSHSDELWALRDVSFEVKRGEVVGIIGRNGAGKSTLLKILSRITEPTSGRVELNGRVASLLEVGTGFHPELTGRENVYLNGAILGMHKREIDRQFDEIVAFAEIERFLDTPVKRYSSGMYVRLAFAVAAHLEPEILLVDEVLAVGDAEFQKKCLGKMGNVAQEGRTVLFVSHNMASLGAICETAVVLASGIPTFRGTIRDGIEHYLSKMRVPQNCVKYQPTEDDDVQFTKIEVVDVEGHSNGVFTLAQVISIRIEYNVPNPLERVQIVCHIWNTQRVHVLATADIDSQPELLEKRIPGSYTAEINIPPFLLAPGMYQVSVASGVPNLRLIADREGPTFEVSALHSTAAQWSAARQDVILALPLTWKISSV